MKKILTIAGSDCSGGAGIQADIKTITAHGMYAMSAVTALTAQNTLGVYAVKETEPEFLARQITCVAEDIPPDAVKVGMVSNADLIRVIADQVQEYKLPHVVLDTVMIASSGRRLLDKGAEQALRTRLMPLAELVTPNLPEAEVLAGMKIRTRKEMVLAANRIADWMPGAVLIKGGHLENEATDLLCCRGKEIWYPHRKLDNPNTHGTGCTLSSSIACGLAEGLDLENSVRRAKLYLTGAIEAGLKLGKGSGPLNHMYKK